MYRKTTTGKPNRSRHSTALSLLCAALAVAALAPILGGIASSAETESGAETSSPSATADPAYGFFSDVPDPPLTGETTVVYEETHYPIKKVDIADISTRRGTSAEEAEPSDDTEAEEPTTEALFASDSAVQTDAPTAPVTDTEAEKEPLISLSSPAVIALGSLLAVMAAITAVALAIGRSRPKQEKGEDKSEE